MNNAPRQAAYLDYVGSGAETIAHLKENGRIVLMWCAFEGPPKILRRTAAYLHFSLIMSYSMRVSLGRVVMPLAVALAILSASVQGQDPAAAYVPRQTDRPTPIDGDEPGFQPIFDGVTLSGWEGNPAYWRAENGTLVGEIRPDAIIKSNTFIVWRGGRPKDFELKLDYRITADGNSGINYRSTMVPDGVTPGNKYAMRGYQFDLDGARRYAGNNYEEKGRLFLAVRGQLTRVVGGRPPVLVATIGDVGQLAAVATDDWNSVHISARGNTLVHMLNGRLMSVVIDDDESNRPVDGLIGVQVHVGPPMKVEYRNIRLKNW